MRIVILLSLLLFSGCINDTGSVDKAIFRYGRIEIIYSPLNFPSAEVESFAYRKEQFLIRLEKMLDVTYDTILPTTIVRDAIGSAAGYYYSGKIVESSGYVHFDDGHEIAHAVTLRMMGRVQTKAMIEGIATFLEFRTNNMNARKELLSYFDDFNYKPSVNNLTDLFSNKADVIKNFKYSEYLISAAFLEYICDQFGMEKLKELWSINITVGGKKLIDQFEKVFGLPFSSIAKSFVSLYE